jgi:hypothetical protein
LTDQNGYVANISGIPDSVLERMAVRTIADGRLLVDVLDSPRVPGTEGEDGRPRATSVERLMERLEWGRDRSLRAMFAADVIRDVAKGGPDLEMLDMIDHTMAILGDDDGSDHGYCCPIAMPVRTSASRVSAGMATIVTE